MKTRLILLAIIYFPGTVLHELSHYFAAKLLFVQTGRISLLPHFKEDGLELGSVQIAKTDFLRRFLIGIAPLVTGVSLLGSIVYIAISIRPTSPWILVLLGYGALTTLNTMSLSKSDLVGSWKVALILLLALAFVIAIQ